MLSRECNDFWIIAHDSRQEKRGLLQPAKSVVSRA